MTISYFVDHLFIDIYQSDINPDLRRFYNTQITPEMREEILHNHLAEAKRKSLEFGRSHSISRSNTAHSKSHGHHHWEGCSHWNLSVDFDSFCHWIFGRKFAEFQLSALDIECYIAFYIFYSFGRSERESLWMNVWVRVNEWNLALFWCLVFWWSLSLFFVFSPPLFVAVHLNEDVMRSEEWPSFLRSTASTFCSVLVSSNESQCIFSCFLSKSHRFPAATKWKR